MIILCVTNCPQGLRGDLSKWLSEVNTGVYVGKLSARVREELWDRVCNHIKSGQATMVYTANNEQGFLFLTHNTTWVPVDYEGITLMRKPLIQEFDNDNTSFLQPGFSKAEKYEKARAFGNGKKTSGYVVLGLKMTGLDCDTDRIMEIGMLRVSGSEVEEEVQYFVQSDLAVSDEIAMLTGITNKVIAEQGIKEDAAADIIREFIGNELVVGYGIQVYLNFLKKLGERTGKCLVIKKIKDIMSISRRKLDNLENFKLETIAGYFSLDVSKRHRALDDCKLMHKIYSELNKL